MARGCSIERQELEVLCRPVGSVSSFNIHSADGLRCRFVSKDTTASDVSAQPEEDGTSVHCFCTSQTLEDLAQASILTVSGGEIVCEVIKKTQEQEVVGAATLFKKLSLLDRFLYVWILLDMALALIIGYYDKGIKKKLQVVELASASLPIAVGLWVMMYPVLCKVRYEILYKVLGKGGLARNLLISLTLNWLVGPALMTGLAWATLPDLPQYRSGVILVGIARCIAMVLIWNDLAKGDPELCAVLVAVNSVMQMVLFTPVSLFYLKVVSRGHAIDVGAWDIARSVLLFLGVPLLGGVITRYSLRYSVGKKWYDTKFIPFIAPWALIGLLYTIFVMFSIQANQIVHNVGNVARVAVPMLLYFSITFSSTLWICRYFRLPYADSVTQAFTASGNNFELAIAVAVGSFGIDSKEALAATIGPLIEVPALLVLVAVALRLQNLFGKKPLQKGLNAAPLSTQISEEGRSPA